MVILWVFHSDHDPLHLCALCHVGDQQWKLTSVPTLRCAVGVVICNGKTMVLFHGYSVVFLQ